MDRAQDVLRCHLCKTPFQSLSMYCEMCCKHICQACAPKHESKKSKSHRVVPYERRWSIECSKHSPHTCELYCKNCDTPVCEKCASSKQHRGHEFIGVRDLHNFENKKTIMEDLEELKNSIYPMYQEIVDNNLILKSKLNENSKTMVSAIIDHGKALHKRVDDEIENLKKKFRDMNSKSLDMLNKHDCDIASRISEIEETIKNLRKLMISKNMNSVSAYKSKIAKFRIYPHKPVVTFPSFSPQGINAQQISQLFGVLNCKTERDSALSSPEQSRRSDDNSKIIAEIDTDYVGDEELRSVCCQSNGDVWTCGNDEIMRLYNIQGKLLKSIQTSSMKIPNNIAVTQGGELMYADSNDRTLNIVKDRRIKSIIRFYGWRPLDFCCTSSGDLLVILESDDYKRTKVVRYADSEQKQEIQFNDKGDPLYSTTGFSKYINENRNLDVCVANWGAQAVVVVNQFGKLRFTYTGPPSKTKRSKPFNPRGLTTDSQSRILVADPNNQRVHIVDQDGQFLCYINNCHLRDPWGLSIDIKDNLYVAESFTGKVKKIKYQF